MITAQDHSDAKASPISTIFTTQSAAQEQVDDVEALGRYRGVRDPCGLLVVIGRRRAMAPADGETMARPRDRQRRQRARRARAADGAARPSRPMQTTSTSAVGDQLAAAHDALAAPIRAPLDAVDRWCAPPARRRPAPRLRKSTAMRVTAKAQGSGSSSSAAWLDAGRPQELGPPALEEAQVVGVIDDAGEVGVLVVDPHRQHVLAAVERAGRAARGHHAHSSNSPGCGAGPAAAAVRPRCR